MRFLGARSAPSGKKRLEDTVEQYLTREQAAQYLGISLGHLAELLREPNSLPVFRLGRRLVFRSSDIDRWIEKFRVNHTAEGLQ